MSKGISMDITARVQGYEASLAKLKQELEKIDLNSSIGKKLSNVLKIAESQVKELNKNLVTNVTTDSQLDHFIEKVNKTGVSIQRITELMEQVGKTDIKTSVFESSINGLVQQLETLETELTDKINTGIQETLSNTNELSEAFSRLGIDTNNKTTTQLFDELTEKAESAEEAVENARKALQETSREVNKAQARLTSLENDPLNQKDAVVNRLEGISKKYISEDYLKKQVQGGLDSIYGKKSDVAQDIFNNFFQGLSEDNLRVHVKELKEKIKKTCGEELSDSEIYNIIFGTKGAKVSAGTVEAYLRNKLFPSSEALEQLKQNFLQELTLVQNSISSSELGKIQGLISNNAIEDALAETKKAFQRAYERLQGEILKQKEKVKEAIAADDKAEENYDQAKYDRQEIESVKSDLQGKIDELKTQNQDLKNQLEALRKEIENKVGEIVGGVQGSAREENKRTEDLKISGEEAEQYTQQLAKVHEAEKMVGKLEGVVQRWFSVYAAIRLVGNAIRSVISTVKELDKTITDIAIVTDMTQQDLWDQMSSYTSMARQYAASISGVYKVSQLYYQQGLQTADVMALTEQTLKMARISGLEYSEATNYMTNAVRSFKMEMTDAQRVVDVYSAIAASSATSTAELASAMSKTASSAEAVGSSFENTTAMMAVMIEATRESAENIGSALKSIISRYGEMKTDPSKLVDSEGEEMSLNKVDKALQSVGISLQDTNHQFRDFDDVIVELADKWDTIDVNTQRYIATIMAGNRQQSRFLALVSNGERLAELSEKAANSEDAATLQVLKTMDSIEAKTQQFHTSIQSLYTDAGIENLYKWILDIGNNVVKTFADMATIGKVPVAAITNIGITFMSLANLVTNGLALLKVRFATIAENIQNNMSKAARKGAQERINIAREEADAKIREAERGAKGAAAAENQQTNATAAAHGKTYNFLNKHQTSISTALSAGGLLLSLIGSQQKDKSIGGISNAFGTAFQGAALGLSTGNPYGALIGGAIGAATGLISNWPNIIQDASAKLQDAQEKATEKNNEYLQKKAETKSLKESIDTLKKLESARYDSIEAEKEYTEAANNLGEKFPGLIKTIDEAGNVTIDLTAAEVELAASRQESIKAAKEAAKANYAAAKAAEDKAGEETKAAKNVDTNALSETLFNIINFSSKEIDLENFKSDLSLDKETLDSDIFNAYRNAYARVAEENIDFYTAFLEELYKTLNVTEEIFDIENLKDASKDIFAYSHDAVSLNGMLASLSSYGIDDLTKLAEEEIINNLFSNISNLEEYLANENNLQDLQSYLGRDDVSDIGKVIVSVVLDTVDEYTKDAKNELQKHQLTEAAERSGIALNVSAVIGTRREEFLKELTNSDQILVNKLYNAYKEKNGEISYDEYIDTYLTADLERFIGQYNDFWNSLSPTRQNELNDLIKNAKKYSQTNFEAALHNLNIDTQIITDLSSSIYSDSYNKEKLKTNLENRIKEREENNKKTIDNFKFEEDILDSIGPDSLQNIYKLWDTIANYVDNNKISTSQANDFITQYEGILEKLSEIENPIEQANVINALTSWEDFSIAGIVELTEKLADLDVDESITNDVKQAFDLIPKNILVELESFSKKVVEQTDNFDKALSSAAKGMNLDDAVKMADTLEVSIKDFDFREGKYFYNNAEKIQEAYFKYNETVLEELEKEYNKEYAKLSRQKIYYGFEKNDKEKAAELEQKQQELVDSWKTTQAAIQEYQTYQVNTFLMQNGFLLQALQNIFTDRDDIENIVANLKAGDYSDFDNEFAVYLPEAIKAVKDVNKNIFDKAFSSIKDGIPQTIEVTESNRDLLTKLGAQIDEATSTAILKLTTNDLENLKNLISDDSGITKETKQNLLKDIHTEQYKDNLANSLENIVSNYNSISYEAAQSLGNALDNLSVDDLLGKGNGIIAMPPFLIESVDGTFKANLERISLLLDSSVDKLGIEKYNSIKAELEKAIQEQSATKILSDIIQNRNKLSEENIESLANLIKVPYTDIANYLHKNADGTYSASLNQLTSFIRGQQNEVTEAVYDLLAEQIDEVISSITGLVGSQTKGFTDLASMQKYVKQVRELGVKDVSISSLFEYNKALHAYQLNTQGLITQITVLKRQLIGVSEEEKQVAEQLINDITRQFAESIDISGYLSLSYGDPAKNLKKEELRKAIEDYNSALYAIGETEGLNAENIIDSLTDGGEKAVRAAEIIAEAQNRVLTAEEVESAYRSQVSNFVNAIDTIVAKPGEIIDATTAQIINVSGGITQEIGQTGQYVVKTAANLYKAYKELLWHLKDTGEATLADINKVAALALENKDGEQQVIDALGDATNMTFSRLGEILANAGFELTEELVNQFENAGIIDLIGGNKIKIIDFNAFANLMGWSADSEEYVSAFKSYNDALIDMNRQAEHNILEEIQNVASAKGGDWINLTQFWEKINQTLGQETFDGAKINNILFEAGAKIEDGILKLDDNANIPAVLQAIAQAAQESGALLSNELAELADTVAEVIKGYADLIKGAISGSLSNGQAEQLQSWAQQFNIKLDFTETQNGLKVATDQAILLYQKLNEIDSIQGKLVFNDLVEALSSDKGGRFENISKTTAEIAKAEKEIAKNNQKISQLVNDDAETNKEDIANLKAKNNELRSQVSLYRQIQQAQSISPDQYNFMDRDLPEVMQGPINYWNSIGEAYKVMNETAQTGKMDIQDFTNIVNEMANLANISGQELELFGQKIDGSAENAAALIQKGYGALSNIDGEGVKVDLSKMGIDFVAGANDASKNFDQGVKTLAKSQIEMLDAAIKMLEVVVAMEKLGDIDVDNNNIFSVGDIFQIDNKGNFKKNKDGLTEYTKEFSEYAKGLIEASKTNEDLAKGLDTFSFNGISLRKMLEDATDGIKKLNIAEDTYFTVLNAFVEAAKSGDYNLDTVQDSVWEIMDKTFPDGSVIKAGNRDIIISGGTHTVIDWESDSIQDALAQVDDNEQAVIDSLVAYANGTSDEVQFKIALIAKGLVNVNSEGQVEVNGNLYDINSKEAKIAMAQAALGDFGAENISKPIELDTGEIEVRGTKKVGSLEFEVASDGASTYYLYNNHRYNSINELKTAIVDERVAAEMKKNNWSGVVNAEEIAKFRARQEVQVELELGQISASSADFTGTERQIQEILNSSKASIQAKINEAINQQGIGDDGKFHATFDNGLEVSFASEKFNATDLANQAVDKLGITTMIAGVAEGIKTAFSSDDSIGKAIGAGILAAVAEGKIDGQVNIPEVNAKLATLNINSVDNVQFGGGGIAGLAQTMLKSVGLASDLVIPSMTAVISNLIINGAQNLDVTNIISQIVTSIQSYLNEINPEIKLIANIDAAKEAYNKLVEEITSQEQKVPVTEDTKKAKNEQTKLIKEIREPQTTPVKANTDKANKSVKILEDYIQKTRTTKVNVKADTSAFAETIKKILEKNYEIKIKVKSDTSGFKTPGSQASAKGNVALSKGNISGEAFASGRNKKLMGELGPELVVSKGRYFLVGQNGPEMVDLEKDAIVFNHLQTESLLKHGKVSTHGRAITNEQNAVSFATGNFEGTALASASSALAALKQLRAMWESLLNASAKDLGSQAGRGGGGGGGGGGGDKESYQPTTVIGDIQRWYNLLRQIDKIEKDLTLQESLQNQYENDRIANGDKIYQNYKNQLALLEKQIKNEEELAILQKSWYDAKVAELNESWYGQYLFTYDDSGLQQYKGSGAPGSGLGLDILENLTRRDANGQAIGNAATAKTQLDYLKSLGFNINDLKYNDDGTTVAEERNGKFIKTEQDENGNKVETELSGEELESAYAAMMENFWNNVDSWRDELDSIYDSYLEQQNKIIENQNSQNEIINKIQDNQIDLEKQVLNAIVESRQAEIDELQKTRDAYDESVNKYIDGLNSSLAKEKQMYQSDKNQTELVQLQRQLSLLQRSGGSGSQIKNLQDQIATKQQDIYFEERQKEIDAIKEASDREIERMDRQIELMTETLEYQKSTGLLWEDVAVILEKSPEEITGFITTNNAEYRAQSVADREMTAGKIEQSAQLYKTAVDDGFSATNSQSIINTNLLNEKTDEEITKIGDVGSNTITSIDTNAGTISSDIQTASSAAENRYNEAKTQRAESENNRNALIQNLKNAQDQKIDAAHLNTKELLAKEMEGRFAAIDYKTEALKKATETLTEKTAEVLTKSVVTTDFQEKIKDSISTTIKSSINTNAAAIPVKADGQQTSSKEALEQAQETLTASIKEILATPVSTSNQTNRVEEAKKIIEAATSESSNVNYGQYINAQYTAQAAKQEEEAQKQAETNTTKSKDKVKTSTKKSSSSSSSTKKTATETVSAVTGTVKTAINNVASALKTGLSNLTKATTSTTTAKKTTATTSSTKKISGAAKKFGTGGLADYTGLAWLDGTPSKPEYVLNAEQTEILRESLLGSKKAHTSLVGEVAENSQNISNSNTSYNNSDNGVTIDKLNFTMQVAKIANDYDAKDAGQQALAEMVRIARKSGNRNVSRR